MGPVVHPITVQACLVLTQLALEPGGEARGALYLLRAPELRAVLLLDSLLLGPLRNGEKGLGVHSR